MILIERLEDNAYLYTWDEDPEKKKMSILEETNRKAQMEKAQKTELMREWDATTPFRKHKVYIPKKLLSDMYDKSPSNFNKELYDPTDIDP